MKTTENRERTKKYLKQIAVNEARISRCRKWIQELKSLDPERYQRYVDETNERIERYTSERDTIITQIVTLPDKYADLLLLLYVKGIRITDLPEFMNLDKRWIYRKVGRALDIFHQNYAVTVDEDKTMKD